MPCAGDPISGVAYACSAEGVLSVLALVPEAAVTDAPEGCEDVPVLLHVTTCKLHVGAVRHWLREISPYPEDVDTYGTAYLLDHLADVSREAGLPVRQLVRSA